MQAERFRALHDELFVMPNPWDRGSARILEELGYPALATTSAGFGRAIGKDDQQVTRDELVAHVADLTDQISVPLNVDAERLYPDQPGGIARTVALLADAGAAGCSIEDYDPATGSIDEPDRATAAVAEAAQACSAAGLVLTARCERHLYGNDGLEETIERLLAYQDAGADVLYAPGLITADDIGRVVGAVDRPLNVLALPGTPPIDDLGRLGVRRVSIGSLWFNAAYDALRERADALRPR